MFPSRSKEKPERYAITFDHDIIAHVMLSGTIASVTQYVLTLVQINRFFWSAELENEKARV